MIRICGLILILLIFSNCTNKNKNNKYYEFSYGSYAKVKANDDKYKFIMNVYEISKKSLSIIAYNKKRKVKNLLGTCDLTWVTTKNGLKVGYNETESECVVFYNNQFYFQTGYLASGIIHDIKEYNNFDNSLIVQQMEISSSTFKPYNVENPGLIKLNQDEINQIQLSNNTSYEEVVKEIIEDYDK